MHLVAILDDCFSVARRILAIDRHYRVFYNTKKARYEVHDQQGLVSRYLLTLPERALTARSIQHVFITQIHNIKKEKWL